MQLIHSFFFRTSIILGLGTFLFIHPLSHVFASKKIYSPIVEKGELELEARGGYTIDDDPNEDGALKQKYAIGYGVTDYWFTEVYTILENEPGEDTEFTEIEFENRFQLFEQGQYWIDTGLYFAYEHSLEDNGNGKFEAKILLEKTTNKFIHDLNIIFEKEFESDHEFESGIAWSSRYRWNQKFEPGLEYFADFGEIGEGLSFDEQKHLLGPVFYGKIGPIKYDIGYLLGLSDQAPDGLFKWIIEYEFYF